MKAKPRSAITRALLVVAILAATLVVYLPALDAGYIWDDDEYLWANPNLLTAEGLRSIWVDPRSSPQYYPLVFTGFWVERRLWGLDPRGYHAVNVALHGANAVLLALLLESLAVPGAWLAALVFAVHPVHVESVAWISERKNVLAGFFYLSSLLAFVRFSRLARTGAAAPPDGRGYVRTGAGPWSLYALSLALFCCALLSKTVTSTLPAVALLLAWWKRTRLSRGDWLALGPFLALGLPLALLTVWLERHHVGAQGPDWAFTLYERILIGGRAFWFYLAKLVWPRELLFFYPRWEIDAGDWRQALFPLAAAALLVGLWLARARIGKGPVAGMAFFVVTLAPALGFFDTWPMLVSFVADHFQYLASIGPIALFATGISLLFSALRTRSRWGVVACLALALALLGIRTWRHGKDFESFEALLRQTIAGNPGSWVARNFLAGILAEQGRIDEAIEEYVVAARLRPHDFQERSIANGVELAAQGRTSLALASFQAVLRVNPGNAVAHNELGVLLARRGDIEGAITHFVEALSLQPDLEAAQLNLERARQPLSPGTEGASRPSESP